MISGNFGSKEFQVSTGVSRETLIKFETYAECLRRWQQQINLIGRGSLDDLWHRHFFDSAQLRELCHPKTRRLVDLGSGAGFPGMVLSIMGQSGVELLESNKRKCSFLGEVARATGTPARITNARFEKVSAPVLADIVTARAVAPLSKLLGDVRRWLKPGGVALLHKGGSFERELTQASKDWTMQVHRHQSRTDPSGAVLEVRELMRANDN